MVTWRLPSLPVATKSCPSPSCSDTVSSTVSSSVVPPVRLTVKRADAVKPAAKPWWWRWSDPVVSEARLNKRIDGVKEEIRAVNHRLDAMNDKMDRLLETLLASKS